MSSPEFLEEFDALGAPAARQLTRNRPAHPIHQLRKDRGLTQEEVARQLGMSQANLSRIENGLHGPSNAVKRWIIEWSGGKITASDLLDYQPSEPPLSQFEAFRNAVEFYLERSGVLPTQFGKDALNDPNFVGDLRAGRSPLLSTVDRVLSFIRKSEERTA